MRSVGDVGVMTSDVVFYTQAVVVETIGDAYVVVGGLPVSTERHADDVVSMAFGMVEVTEMVTSPADMKPIKTPASPRTISSDFSLSVPKGMFRTPTPSPPPSKQPSPCQSPQQTTSPLADNSPETSQHGATITAPSITISSADEEENSHTRARRQLRFVSEPDASDFIRRRLMTSPLSSSPSPPSTADASNFFRDDADYETNRCQFDAASVADVDDPTAERLPVKDTPKIVISDNQTAASHVLERSILIDYKISKTEGNNTRGGMHAAVHQKMWGEERFDYRRASRFRWQSDAPSIQNGQNPRPNQTRRNKLQSDCEPTFGLITPPSTGQREDHKPAVGDGAIEDKSGPNPVGGKRESRHRQRMARAEANRRMVYS
ncbi:hypothetical protein LSH36_7g05008 [Paralvinella palmiformis]|uniref:Guanylate cyclase domain-containing protein n=1 Tax=Paralvinella palmiformis TaxID=53620 RepID=A0AAD9NGS6_9ANNE|nr:hypothetical protein LSH36_7g05008 [Paralvinella palmiformis]